MIQLSYSPIKNLYSFAQSHFPILSTAHSPTNVSWGHRSVFVRSTPWEFAVLITSVVIQKTVQHFP